MRLRLNVELVPMETRAVEWCRRGAPPVSTVPGVGYIKAGELRDYLQRRLNNDLGSIIRDYLEALVRENAERAHLDALAGYDGGAR